MTANLSRRFLLVAGLGLPLLGLPACATIGNYAYEDAVRRLLTVSSQRAFARLLEENGFSADELIIPPPALSDAGLRPQLIYAVQSAARAAPPIVREAIRNMVIPDAAAIFRGSPTAATDLLRREMGEALFTALVPEVGDALRRAGAPVDQALAAAPALNFEGLRLDVARRASDALYKAIGREEAAIRADPASVRDLILRSSLR